MACTMQRKCTTHLVWLPSAVHGGFARAVGLQADPVEAVLAYPAAGIVYWV